jgi:hypothetical protein
MLVLASWIRAQRRRPRRVRALLYAAVAALALLAIARATRRRTPPLPLPASPPPGAYACGDAPLCVAPDGGTHVFWRGEFGSELIYVLPHAFALHRRGLLNRTFGCGAAMAAFYSFSPAHTDVPECARRYDAAEVAAVAAAAGFAQPHAGRPPASAAMWQPPPLRRTHAAQRMPQPPPGAAWSRTRPLVILHNKYSEEWGHDPVNFFSLPLLAQVLAALRGCCQVVYNHPGFADAQRNLPLGDVAWLRRHKLLAGGEGEGANSTGKVILMQDVADANPDLSYNAVQLRVHARAAGAVAVQGGLAALAAALAPRGGDVVVLHRAGHETEGGEYAGVFAALHGARIAVATTDSELRRALRNATTRWAAAGKAAAAAAATT